MARSSRGLITIKLYAPTNIATPASANLSNNVRPYAVPINAVQLPMCRNDRYEPVMINTPTATAATVEKFTTVRSHNHDRSSAFNVCATRGTTNAISASPPTQIEVAIK